MPMLKPGEVRSYDYTPIAGTHWMHSHVPAQEMQLLAAPLIVLTPSDLSDDRQEVVMFLHDFSFKPAEEVLTMIAGGASHHMAGIDHGAAPVTVNTDHGASRDNANMPGMKGMSMEGMAGKAMDLNDYDFDAYLANDRTLSDPEVIRVEKGGRVRLRIINASAATIFWIDTGTVEGQLVAADGHAVRPVSGTRFGIAMAQRLDIVLDLPKGSGVYPVLALREGARERTGIILATSGAEVSRIGALAEIESPAFDTGLEQEASLTAMTPLPVRQATKTRMMMLAGSMRPYFWTIDRKTWGDHVPVTATSGERVEITFHNMSMMAHPMHLHGHSFQVVGIDGRRFLGAVRDTVLVPPMKMVTIAVDAGEAARWMLHCHHMPHLSTGMMAEFAVSA